MHLASESSQFQSKHICTFSKAHALVLTPNFFPGNEKLIDLLFETGADFNAKDDDGSTPLLVAAKNADDNVKLVEKLISHGAKLDITDKHGQNALHVAAKHGILI